MRRFKFLPLFSAVPQPGAPSCQCFDAGKMEASPLGSTPTSLQVRCMFQASLPPQGEARSFLPTVLCAGGRALLSEFHEVPYRPHCSGFALPGVQEPITGF